MMFLRPLVLAATAVLVHSFAPSPATPASLRRLSSPSQQLPLSGMKKPRAATTRVQAVLMPGTETASFLSLLHLADSSHFSADVAASAAALQDAMQLLSDAAAAAAADATEDKPGVFGSFVNLIVACLNALHSAFKTAGIPGAWGYAIATFTIFVKAVTYPLNFKQMSSTIALQQLQPKVKAIQSRYANDPQTQNEKIAELYRTENVNPLAGCLPTLIQIPVFIGLYRSVLQLAQKDLLEESFLWIPSLQGPVGEYNAKTGLPMDASAWLFKGWTDGHPSLGWEATLAYLSLPIILVITQTLSQKILQPAQSNDPAQQQTQQILKFLPFMIGWFALNVPAGLGVYWVFNNVISTGQQWYIRQQFKDMQPSSSVDTMPTKDVSLKELSTPKLRDAEELSFKPTTSKEAKAEVSEDDEDDDTEQQESKSAAKKKARAAKKKKN